MFCCSAKPPKSKLMTQSEHASPVRTPTVHLARTIQADSHVYYVPDHQTPQPRFSIMENEEISIEESLVPVNQSLVKKLIQSTLTSADNSIIMMPEPVPQIIQQKRRSTVQQRRSVSMKQQPEPPQLQEEQADEDDEKEMTEEEAANAALFKWAKENFAYSKDKDQQAIMRTVDQFAPFNSKEESRTPAANKSGGKQCKDKKLVKTIRAIGKTIIKQVGKKVLSGITLIPQQKGSFNLTTISFPIRAMIPKSALEKALQATCLFPLYINKAAGLSDPVERLKYVIVATVGNFYINCSFLKPLNPILGETIEASYKDGTKLYAEQITHHPPISYFTVFGMKYQFFGYYCYEAKAGLNSLSLKNTGKRTMKFYDGQTIEYNFAAEEYSGSFWGAMKLEALGKMCFTDKKNNIKAEFTFDNVRWKPTDFFSGEIKQNNKVVSKVYGSYMGFIEFDGNRYWDYTKVQPYMLNVDSVSPHVKSDHSFRQDKLCLLNGDLERAQQYKDELEQSQRNDATLRKAPKKKQK